jgi:Ca2+-binding RTX toxin-like protein
MVHHIKANDGSSIEVASGDAFSDGGPDTTLLVDADAYLISDNGTGALLIGDWTATINGAVEDLGGSSIGIHAGDGLKLTVGKSGDVSGGVYGVRADDGLTLTNFGVIGGGSEAIFTQNSASHIANAGLLRGDVALNESGATDDTFTDFVKVGKIIKNGKVTGTVTLGDGADHFNGGNNAEKVTDAGGADVYKLGGGNDTYFALNNGAVDGTDVVNGGSGVDTYDASGATHTMFINLDKVDHDLSPYDVGGFEAANTASGTDIAGFLSDTVFGFENVKGGHSDDIIYGNAAANVLEGGDGVNRLFGFGGNDTLIGGANIDGIIGGTGKDILIGGGGADSFAFGSIKDSGVSAATRDVIEDFLPGTDSMNLGKMDANTKVAGNDAFTFIGVHHFHASAGELRESFSDGNTVVSGDVNGDGKADFAITLSGHLLLHGYDFNL